MHGFLPLSRGAAGSVPLQRLDRERRRRRVQLLAEIAEAASLRDRVATRRARSERLRELIAARRNH